MKSLVKKLWDWLKSVFCKDESKSILLKILMEGIHDPELEHLFDSDIGAKAIQFVKELNQREDLTGKEKAAIFNEKLAEYAKKVGKVIAVAMINLLRELAVAAVKIALINAEAALILAETEKKLQLENKSCSTSGQSS